MNKTVATILTIISISAFINALQQWWFPNENCLSGWALFNWFGGVISAIVVDNLLRRYKK